MVSFFRGESWVQSLHAVGQGNVGTSVESKMYLVQCSLMINRLDYGQLLIIRGLE